MNILFIGYGRMGSALGEAWSRANPANRVYALDPVLPANANANVVTSVNEFDNVVFDLIVIGVKPTQVTPALRNLPASYYASAIVISVAAGVTRSQLQSDVGDQCPVVRVMPNTAVLVGAGCSAICAGEDLTTQERQTISDLFDSVGKSYWVDDERQLDAVTAISGSGPAYYHLFSEALASVGVSLGLPKELALGLAVNTAYGAAKLQIQSGADLVELRHAVTSPNGTTAAAINVFERESALRSIVSEAVLAAAKRSVALSQG